MTGLVLGVVTVVAVTVVLAVRVTHRSPSAVPPVQHRVGSTTADRPSRADAAGALLDRLSRLLEGHGSTAEVRALAAPDDSGSARQLADLRGNVHRLGITDLAMRYVSDADGHLSADQLSALGDHTWVGDVALTWRLRGFDVHDNRLEVPVTFRDDGATAAFVTTRRSYGEATPLWLLERVAVSRGSRSLVVAGSGQALGRFSHLAQRAVVDVRKVLPAWRGRLVVEVPHDQAELTHVLGAQPGTYGEIAAVTTTVDGSLTPGSPVHIFVNPLVFDPLGPRGSQIVLSHEATHVATRAAFSSMPTWLVEGFADYVALDHVHLPVSVTASQILSQVRRHGAPLHLPGPREFDMQNVRLGASYESAWLACRLLGQTYGEQRLIRFYRASDRASSTTGPFRRILGTDQRAFTLLWRQDLRRLAR